MLRSLPFRWQPESVTQDEVFQAMAIQIEYLAYERRLVFDQLVKVRGLSVSNCPDLEDMSFPLLEEIVADGNLWISWNERLRTVSFPKLMSFSPGSTTSPLQIAYCPALTTLTFPELASWGGQGYDFSNNALSAETVNHILARMAADQAFEWRAVDLSGGTNAAPTGQGLIDKATLEARHCTIITN